MADLILREWNGKNIRIREDRYVCLTDMAKASGKLLGNWTRLDATKSYLEALSRSIHIPVDQLVVSVTTGPNKDRGTWGHSKVSLRFAQWCSDDFAIQVDSWIDELLTTGSVTLNGQKVYTIDTALRLEPAGWDRMFSAKFKDYAERLTGWDWNWSCMGQFINATCYAYLPHDIVEELKGRNPKIDDRRRAHKHHQFLQPEIRDIVTAHLLKVETLMVASKGNMTLFTMLMVNHFNRFKMIGDGEEMPLFRSETVYILNQES